MANDGGRVIRAAASVQMHNLNSELHFPKPPFRVDSSFVDLLPQAVSSYLDQIRSWRLAVLEFIDGSSGKPAPAIDGLTERAQQALATFLASHWTQGMTDYATRPLTTSARFPRPRSKPAPTPPWNQCSRCFGGAQAWWTT